MRVPDIAQVEDGTHFEHLPKRLRELVGELWND
jgi:hypothetical protein